MLSLLFIPFLSFQVVALWRYRKKAANGAPFVYECSELVACASPEEQMVRAYVAQFKGCVYRLHTNCTVLFPVFSTVQLVCVDSRLEEGFRLNMDQQSNTSLELVRALQGSSAFVYGLLLQFVTENHSVVLH